MEKILRDTFRAKKDFREGQLLFYKKFNKNYPTILKINHTDMIRSLEKELKYLLSTCVIFKTGRISIKADWDYKNGKEEAFITQRPKIHYRNSSNDDINFLERDYKLSINCDLLDTHKTKLFLSELKNFPRQIDSNQLDIFFKFLKEIMVFKDRIYEAFDQTYHSTSSNVKTLKKGCFTNKYVFVKINNAGFELAKYDGERSGSITYQNTVSNRELLDYTSENYYNGEANAKDYPEFSDTLQSNLALLIHHCKFVFDTLDKVEANKSKLNYVTKTFVSGMEKYTIPFKVMKKLKS